MYSMSIDDEDGLRRLHHEKTSHQELPYLIHAKTHVPYLMGRHGHTIIAVELKKFGWKLKLVESTSNNDSYIAAKKGKEKWLIQVISTNTELSEALHKVKHDISKELETMTEENGAHPVIAIVALDSAAFVSAKTLMGLSLI